MCHAGTDGDPRSFGLVCGSTYTSHLLESSLFAIYSFPCQAKFQLSGYIYCNRVKCYSAALSCEGKAYLNGLRFSCLWALSLKRLGFSTRSCLEQRLSFSVFVQCLAQWGPDLTNISRHYCAINVK